MGARQRLNAEQIDKMIRWREQGKSCATIAKWLGVSAGAINYQCLRAGVLSPNQRGKADYSGPASFVGKDGRTFRRFTDEEDVRMLALAASGLRNVEHAYEAIHRIRTAELPKVHRGDAASAPEGSTGTAVPAGTELSPVVEDVPPLASPVVSSTGGGASDRDLKALAGLVAVHPAGLTEAAWATRTQYSRKGGAWIRRRARYRDAGLIEQRDGRWFATIAGVVAVGDQRPNMPAPGRPLTDWWAARLGAPGRLLKILADTHPRALTREGLAAEANMAPKGGAFIRHIGELKAAELFTDQRKRLAIAPGLMGDA